eukprot:gene34516-44607_t
MVGYWEPHSSSVEFCEPNYALTPYVAEPHNAWSSIFIFVIAVNGLFYGNPLDEIRVSLMFIALALVGIGSTALHSTLHWFWQSSDELTKIRIPMETQIDDYCFVGSTLWIIDMNYCEYLLPYYLSSGLGGMTFHVLWHMGAGLGTYVTITFLILVRLQALKKDVYLHWVYNSLPVCKLNGPK